MARIFCRLIVSTIVIASPLSGLSAAEAGTSGFLFLRLGNGARAAGMGDAFTAVADDATFIAAAPAMRRLLESLGYRVVTVTTGGAMSADLPLILP